MTEIDSKRARSADPVDEQQWFHTGATLLSADPEQRRMAGDNSSFDYFNAIGLHRLP